MKLGFGLYRHMLTRDYYDFARQCVVRGQSTVWSARDDEQQRDDTRHSCYGYQAHTADPDGNVDERVNVICHVVTVSRWG